MPIGCDDCASPAIADDVADGLIVDRNIQRNDHKASPDNAVQSLRHLETVLHENDDAITLFKSGVKQAIGYLRG